jgi:nucleotide-binding universal stress UspA family protein
MLAQHRRGGSSKGSVMRTYLVVIDDSEESRLAQRFASRRAARTGGNVHFVVALEKPAFVAWGGVQATIEAEAREKAEAVAAAAAAQVHELCGIHPSVTVAQGDAAEIIREILLTDHSIAALVLGAAEEGPPGPLVSHFAGADAGKLPVPVMIVPGSLSVEQLDRLS